MPKPGPKPYECIRRAWHSDSHGQLRCQVMQKAFRMVTRMHRPQTTLSSIWREKMTKTVMRVDEILYSSARSQAEYEDPTTLASRLTEAVDSIISRNEEGDEVEGRRLLPCVEVALTIAQQPLASPMNRNNRTYAASRNSLREIRPREQGQASSAHNNSNIISNIISNSNGNGNSNSNSGRLVPEQTGGDDWSDRTGEGSEHGFKPEGSQIRSQNAAERPLLCDSFGNRSHQPRGFGIHEGILHQSPNPSLVFRGDLNQPTHSHLGDPALSNVRPTPEQTVRSTPTEIAFLLPLSLPGSSCDVTQAGNSHRSSWREEAGLVEHMEHPQQSGFWEGAGRKGGGSQWESLWLSQRSKVSPEDLPAKRARQEPSIH